MLFDEDQLAIQDLARRFAREKLAPHYQARDKSGVLERVVDPRDGRARPDGRRPAGTIWRPRRARRHRRRRRGGARLWRFQHQRGAGRGVAARRGHHEQRHAGACGILGSPDGQRRDADGRLRHRAERRLRCRRHEAAVPARRRPLRARWREDVDHVRRLRRRVHRVRPHRLAPRAAPPGSPR